MKKSKKIKGDKNLKREIRKLFKSGRYFSDISSELDMGLKEVVKVCKELCKEGKVHTQQ